MMENLSYLIILVILVIFYFYFNKENFADTSQSTEAIANIASLYNQEQLKISNLSATNNINSENITVDNNLTVNGYTTTNSITNNSGWIQFGKNNENQFVLQVPQDNRRALYIAPRKKDNTDWDWGNGLGIDYLNNNINFANYNLVTGGQLCIGKTCINESQLQYLTGAKPIRLGIQSAQDQVLRSQSYNDNGCGIKRIFATNEPNTVISNNGWCGGNESNWVILPGT